MRRGVRGAIPQTASTVSNYRLGTSMLSRRRSSWLSSTFSAPAARILSSMDFIGFAQCALLFSVPLLIARGDSRRDFAAYYWTRICQAGAVFLVGVSVWCY